MKERHFYEGVLNGVRGVWCDKKPRGLKEVKDVTFYTADEGMTFEKDGEFFANVIIKDGVNINDYTEVKDLYAEEKPEDHIADDSKMVEEAPQGE